MKISFDLDETSAKYPDIFVAMGRAFKKVGHTVFILTACSRELFDGDRKNRYPHLRDESWYDDVIGHDNYNEDERNLQKEVDKGKFKHNTLVAIFKRRICRERGIAVHFDDDAEHIRQGCDTLIFGVK